MMVLVVCTPSCSLKLHHSHHLPLFTIPCDISNAKEMIDEIISGPILAMEIACSVNEFRAHVGPWDVEVAKTLYPTSIRAKFGKNTIQNAVHCTDLTQEAGNELSYFFDILSDE